MVALYMCSVFQRVHNYACARAMSVSCRPRHDLLMTSGLESYTDTRCIHRLISG